uniref:Uncharacterized protein n=1 Tax=Timema bartmani TaxID=61472 RepID=A0A7R9HVR5_9NEOP|nr:unnamed protein product [Timema bartmani]
MQKCTIYILEMINVLTLRTHGNRIQILLPREADQDKEGVPSCLVMTGLTADMELLVPKLPAGHVMCVAMLKEHSHMGQRSLVRDVCSPDKWMPNFDTAVCSAGIVIPPVSTPTASSSSLCGRARKQWLVSSSSSRSASLWAGALRTDKETRETSMSAAQMVLVCIALYGRERAVQTTILPLTRVSHDVPAKRVVIPELAMVKFINPFPGVGVERLCLPECSLARARIKI